MAEPLGSPDHIRIPESGNSGTLHSIAMEQAEPFPNLQAQMGHPSPTAPTCEDELSGETRHREQSNSSTLAGRLRSASKKFEESSLPLGMWDATASIATTAPSVADIRRGSFGSEGWSADGQLKERERRASLVRRRSSLTGDESFQSPGSRTSSNPQVQPTGLKPRHDSLSEAASKDRKLQLHMTPTTPAIRGGENQLSHGPSTNKSSTDSEVILAATPAKKDMKYRTTPFDNGYQFPPKHTWTETTLIGLTAFWQYFITPLGFVVTIYGLNVVAWGGMIFLLLCNAAPAMCHPTCDDINSPRRIWIEIDSQVLTALFCVTGFGLIPWRFRDLYYLLRFRLLKDQMGLRRLAGIHRGWFRLEGSQNLPVDLGPSNIETEYIHYQDISLPFPLKFIPEAPLTGIRAPPTPLWRLDYVIWMFVWNTFLQAVLSGLMWGLNRYNRPSWSTGVFVALACIVAALAGIEIFIQGKRVKAVEGIPVSNKDLERLQRDRERGRLLWNNISGAPPKERKIKTQNGGLSSRIFKNEAARKEPT